MNSFELHEFLECLDSDDDAISALVAIERKFGMVGCTYTRLDVNEMFRSMFESHELDVRDLTDAEWDEFRAMWFWRKGYQDVLGAGASDAIYDDLTELFKEQLK